MTLTKGNRVLFASQHAGFIGGLEIYIYRVSKLLRSRGIETFAIYDEAVAGAEKYLSGFDKAVHISEIGSLSAKDFDICTLHKISNPKNLEILIDKFNPIVFIHDHDYFCPKGYKYFPYKRINCKRSYSQIQCGICSSIVPPRHIKDGVVKILEKNFHQISKLNSLIKKCPSFVVLSRFMKWESIQNGIAPDKIKVIHPFLDVPEKINRKENDGVARVVFAGQQVMSKGTPLFLEAISKMKCSVSAHILGKGARFEDFRKMSEDMGLDSRVHFEGYVSGVENYFERSDIAVFPSLWQEPFGLSGIEAMMYELPVVAFNVGGVTEWLRTGLNGIVVKERDTTAMAEAIDSLILDKDLRLEMGVNAREYVSQNFSAEQFFNSFENLI